MCYKSCHFHLTFYLIRNSQSPELFLSLSHVRCYILSRISVCQLSIYSLSSRYGKEICASHLLGLLVLLQSLVFISLPKPLLPIPIIIIVVSDASCPHRFSLFSPGIFSYDFHFIYKAYSQFHLPAQFSSAFPILSLYIVYTNTLSSSGYVASSHLSHLRLFQIKENCIIYEKRLTINKLNILKSTLSSDT